MPTCILLTGGTGYLGSRLLPVLLGSDESPARESRRVVVYKRSTSSLARLESALKGPLAARVFTADADRVSAGEVMEEHGVDVVVHCATDYGRGGSSAAAMTESNVLFPLRILEALAVRVRSDGRAPIFINADTSLAPDVSVYARTKSHFRDWLKDFSNRVSCVNLRLEHFYGPEDDSSKFVTRMIREMLAGRESIDLTAGEQRRDFIHIDDVARAYSLLLDFVLRDGTAGGVAPRLELDLGSGDAVAVRDLLILIRELCGANSTKLNFGAVPYRENEAMLAVADISGWDGKSAPDWKPGITLRDGLGAVIARERA